jgi:hypothetical protein
MRARYSSIEDAVELSWTPPGTSDFVGYSVDVVIDGADPVTVCTGGEPDAGCSVPADGIYDVEYATWTVTVVDGGNNGLSASAVTDGLHLLEDIWVKPHAPEDVAFGTGQGEFNLPFGVEVDDGSVHVAEQANNRLQTLTDEGDFLGFVGAIGGMTGLPGDGDGEFNAPMDVAVGDDGLLYVADHTNARVQVFDGITRQFQFEFGTLGEAEGQLRFPVALDFDGDGNLHVVESVNARVSVFDADGNFVSTYASIDGAPLDFPGRIAWLAELQVMAVSDGAVLRLYATGPGGSDATWELLDAAEDAEVGGVCTTEYGELVVTVDDAVTTGGSAGHRLLKVDRDGVVFGELGEWGVGDDQFWRPVSCDVDDDGVLWVADGLNHRVKLLGP